MALAVTLPLNHHVCREMYKYKSTLDLCQPHIPIYWTTQICQTIDRSNISPLLSIATCFYILLTMFTLKTNLQCKLCVLSSFLNRSVNILYSFPTKFISLGFLKEKLWQPVAKFFKDLARLELDFCRNIDKACSTICVGGTSYMSPYMILVNR